LLQPKFPSAQRFETAFIDRMQASLRNYKAVDISATINFARMKILHSEKTEMTPAKALGPTVQQTCSIRRCFVTLEMHRTLGRAAGVWDFKHGFSHHRLA
jgi:hypothetical protein